MFASHSPEYQLFSLFESLLRNVLSGKNEYKPYVDKVLFDTRRLALDRKDIFVIDSESLPIVLFLNQRENAYFKTLNPSEISKEEYSHVLGLINNAEIPFD